LDAFSRVSWRNCLRGCRQNIKTAKCDAFSKICSKLLVVFFFSRQLVSLRTRYVLGIGCPRIDYDDATATTADNNDNAFINYPSRPNNSV